MNLKKFLFFIISLITLNFSAFAEVETNSFTIGVITPLSGPTAFYGQSIQRGVELALMEINAVGGIKGKPVRVVFEGFDYLNLKTIPAATNKLLHVDKAQALLTTWSEDTEIVAPIAKLSKIPVIAVAAGSKNLTKRSPYLFRVWPSDESFINAEISYALSKGKTRPAIIAAQAAYFSSLKEITTQEWEKISKVSPIVEEVTPSEADFRSVLTRLKAQRPDVLFLHMPLERMGTLLQQAEKMHFDILKFGTQESDSATVVDVAGTSADGLIFPAYELATIQFQQAHIQKFNKKPEVASEYAYDAVKLLTRAALENGTDPEELVRGLLSTRDYIGASGTIAFTADRDRTPKRVVLKVVKNGKGIEITK